MALDYLGNIKFGSEPPTFPTDSNGIAGFFSGFASGEEQKIKRRERKAVKPEETTDPNDPNATSDQPLSGLVSGAGGAKETASGRTWLGDLSKAFLGAKGEAAKGADPLFDVRKLTSEQTAQMNALTIKGKLEDRQRAIEAVEASSDFSNLVGNALKSPDPTDPAVRSQIVEFMGRHPYLKKSESAMGMFEQYEKGVDDIQKSRAQDELIRYHKDQFGPGGMGGRPEALTRRIQTARQWEAEATAIRDIDPVRADELLADATELRRREPAPPAPLRTAQSYGQLVAERAAMPPGADTTGIDATIAKLAPTAPGGRIRELTDKEASGIPLTPGEAEELKRIKRPTTEVYGENLITGEPEVKQVEGRYIAPVDMKERVLSLRKNTDALGLLDEVERKGGTDFVGLKPAIETLIYDQILPQLGINKSNERRVMSKSDFVQFVQRGIRGLNAEARLSNQDATMLMEAFPQLDKWLSSPPQAKAIIKSLRRGLAIGAVRDAKGAHRGVPAVAGDSLFLDDWFELERSGSLTHAEAVELAARYKAQRRPPSR